MAAKKQINFFTETEKVEKCTACGQEIPVGVEFGVIEGLNYVVCRSCVDNPNGIRLK